MIYMPRQVAYMSRWAILLLLVMTDDVQLKLWSKLSTPSRLKNKVETLDQDQ
jgi:hypothetical protein